MATRHDRNFAILSSDEQLQVVRTAIGQYARALNVGFKNKRIAEGQFHPLPDESEDDQITRSRREYYVQESYTLEEGQFLSTCTLCNFHLPARKYTRETSIFISSGCLCPRKRFIEGCHFIQGHIPLGTFPDNNVFVHYIWNLPVPIVINHKQLMASVMGFLENQGTTYFQAQSQPIINWFGPAFERCKAYQRQETEHKTLSTGFSKILIATFKKLREVPGFATIGPRFTERTPNPAEKAAFGSDVPKRFTLFSFGAPTEDSQNEPTAAQMKALEDMTFCNYQRRLTELAEQRIAERGSTAGSTSASGSSSAAGREDQDATVLPPVKRRRHR
jgi:hypothetical protein